MITRKNLHEPLLGGTVFALGVAVLRNPGSRSRARSGLLAGLPVSRRSTVRSAKADIRRAAPADLLSGQTKLTEVRTYRRLSQCLPGEAAGEGALAPATRTTVSARSGQRGNGGDAGQN